MALGDYLINDDKYDKSMCKISHIGRVYQRQWNQNELRHSHG